jgi:hypothetical protein
MSSPRWALVLVVVGLAALSAAALALAVSGAAARMHLDGGCRAFVPLVAGTALQEAAATPSAPSQPTPTFTTAPPEPLVLGIAALECGGSDEFIRLANVGTTPGDLAGWRVRSAEGNQTYVFGSRLLLPGDSVALHSGPDAPPTGGQDVRWTLSYVWNNSGDMAELYSPAGDLVQEEDCTPGPGQGAGQQGGGPASPVGVLSGAGL